MPIYCGQVSTHTGHYQLPIFRCTNVQPRRYACPLFRWCHELEWAHNTIKGSSEVTLFNYFSEFPCSLCLWLLQRLSLSPKHQGFHGPDRRPNWYRKRWQLNLGPEVHRRDPRLVETQHKRNSLHGKLWTKHERITGTVQGIWIMETSK